MKDYTKKQKKAYLKRPTRCPDCGCEDISAGQVDIDGGYASQEVSCVCGARWIDIYKLIDVERVEERTKGN